MTAIPVTVRGEQQLRDELKQLKTLDRPRVIEAISEARAHGDLKENAEYHAAREQQSFVEGRIQDIESKLGNLQVIDVSKMDNQGKVIFGATVTVVNADTDEEKTYQIVGDDESDIKQNKISFSAPIARAMMGKLVDDTFDFQTPQGDIASYDIIQVDYI